MGKVTKRVIHGLLAMLGFSACTTTCGDLPGPLDMYGPPVAEYGVPHVEFTFKGRVLDKDGNPIPGIKVSPLIEVGSQGTLHTDENGEVEGRLGFVQTWDLEKIGIAFEDEDGPENGGSFARDTLRFKDLNVQKVKEGSGWNEGTYHSDFEKTLTPKDE